jgi:hypothetical protein
MSSSWQPLSSDVIIFDPARRHNLLKYNNMCSVPGQDVVIRHHLSSAPPPGAAATLATPPIIHRRRRPRDPPTSAA